LVCRFEYSFVDEEDSPVGSQVDACSMFNDDGGGRSGGGGKGNGKDGPLCPFCFYDLNKINYKEG
jgi:hypothetical protein